MDTINLESINSNLLKCIEDIHKKKILLDQEINEALDEKTLLERDIDILTKRLSEVSKYLECKKVENKYFDTKIVETENAYSKICESSKILLNVLSP